MTIESKNFRLPADTEHQSQSQSPLGEIPPAPPEVPPPPPVVVQEEEGNDDDDDVVSVAEQEVFYDDTNASSNDCLQQQQQELSPKSTLPDYIYPSSPQDYMEVQNTGMRNLDHHGRRLKQHRMVPRSAPSGVSRLEKSCCWPQVKKPQSRDIARRTNPIRSISSSQQQWNSNKTLYKSSARPGLVDTSASTTRIKAIRSAPPPSTYHTNLNNLHNANIQVVTRIRPMNELEIGMGAEECMAVDRTSSCKTVHVVQGQSHSTTDDGNVSYMTKTFMFDSCLGPDDGQDVVFEKCGMEGLLDDAMAGVNVTVFAYGQTGSGKTYTIHGMLDREEYGFESQGDDADGIIPRALEYIFRKMKKNSDLDNDMINNMITTQHDKMTCGASYCEIYNEAVYDLLLHIGTTPLKLKWDSGEGFHAPDIHIQPCNTLQDAQAVLSLGNRRRKQRAHLLNPESSRSHAILTLYLHTEEDGVPMCSKINFVDLAGSERLKESGSEDGVSMKETANINKSLFLLGNVICALSAGQPNARVPYRESKLTKLLFGSMASPSKCLMIACCSPRYVYMYMYFVLPRLLGYMYMMQ